MFEFSRFLLPALTVFTVFQAFLQLFAEQMQFLRLWGMKNHSIVCGLGRKGSKLVEELVERGEKVIVIERNADSENIKRLRTRGVIILNGDANDTLLLERARLKRARYLFAFLGDDRQNIAIALTARQMCSQPRHGELACIAYLSSYNLFHLLNQSELNKTINIPFRLEVFNLYDRGARSILERDKINSLKNDQTRLLVIGFGRLAEALVLAKCRERFIEHSSIPLEITILDISAKTKITNLLSHYPQLNSVCKLTPMDIDINSIDFIHNDFLAMKDMDKSIQRIFICVSDPVLSLQTSLSLLEQLKHKNVPILMRLEEDNGISALITAHKEKDKGNSEVQFFDLYKSACSVDLLMGGAREQLARDLHQNYLVSTENLSFPANQSWEKLPEYWKEANRQQVDRIQSLLTECGYQTNILMDWNSAERTFTVAEIEEMAQIEHDLWVKYMQAAGWRFDVVKDEKNRTHPGLQDWQQLTEADKEKNRVFIKQLPRHLAQLGIQIDKIPKS